MVLAATAGVADTGVDGMKRVLVCRQHQSEEVPWLRPEWFRGHELPRPVALVNGAFDLLHVGHMRLLFAAADHAKTVICALDSDRKIEAAKGHRPVIGWAGRAAYLKYMPVAGLVEIDGDAEFRELVRWLKPDLRVLGVEYVGHKSRCPEVPVVYVPYRGLHTADIIRRCQEL